jgi:hypothetical protein
MLSIYLFKRGRVIMPGTKSATPTQSHGTQRGKGLLLPVFGNCFFDVGLFHPAHDQRSAIRDGLRASRFTTRLRQLLAYNGIATARWGAALYWHPLRPTGLHLQKS